MGGRRAVKPPVPPRSEIAKFNLLKTSELKVVQLQFLANGLLPCVWDNIPTYQIQFLVGRLRLSNSGCQTHESN
jgi:hypothetical protein